MERGIFSIWNELDELYTSFNYSILESLALYYLMHLIVINVYHTSELHWETESHEFSQLFMGV